MEDRKERSRRQSGREQPGCSTGRQRGGGVYFSKSNSHLNNRKKEIHYLQSDPSMHSARDTLTGRVARLWRTNVLTITIDERPCRLFKFHFISGSHQLLRTSRLELTSSPLFIDIVSVRSGINFSWRLFNYLFVV